MSNKEVLIENWSIVQSLLGPYDAPEKSYAMLQGAVYGHPNRDDGDLVSTSRIIKIDPNAGWAETRSRIYKLGTVDPEFKKFLESNGYKFSDYRFDVVSE